MTETEYCEKHETGKYLIAENNEELKKLLSEAYENYDNFLIDDQSDENKIAMIYCSGNGIYTPNTPEVFREKIITKNRFEWTATKVDYPAKHIFIRDITKCFYQNGINSKINSVEKLTEFLKKETEGFKVRITGSSSGGFASVLFGMLLNAEYVLTFSCPYHPFILSDEYNSLAVMYKNYKYMNLVDYVKASDIPIFYMLPSESECDKPQYPLVRDCKNIRFASIISPSHGVPVNRYVLKKIINSSFETLEKIYVHPPEKPVSEFEFVKIHFGKRAFIKRVFDYIKKYPLFFLRKDFYKKILCK